MRRYVGPALMLIGIGHLIVVSVFFSERFAAIARDGLFNTVNGDDKREAAFWTMWFGVLLLTVGYLIRFVQAHLGTVPGFPGWVLLVMGLGGGILLPASPFWLLILLGLFILRPARSSMRSSPSASSSLVTPPSR
ncbi:MAG: hypothetical protein K0S14_119 [Thermomicrobiales bacterium]|jgi:hypothetical protein|nr:hypothetical protein [Thermomicrobiales bacterium]MDF2757729.1 hypothetical protein [Thermomicrobiales bacterium]